MTLSCLKKKTKKKKLGPAAGVECWTMARIPNAAVFPTQVHYVGRDHGDLYTLGSNL